MKKIVVFLLTIICCTMITGCKKYDEKDVVKDFKKNLEKSKGYSLKGELEIVNNEDSYLYDVEVYYQKDDKFKVSLKNKINNHEQIILRNKDGVYVLTRKSTKQNKMLV